MPKQLTFPPEAAKTRAGLIVRTCPTCHKDFAIYKSLAKSTKQSWCSKKCWSEGRTEVDRYAKATGKKGVKSAIKRILKQSGFYKSHKDEYKDKIIDCPESPTGRAYVGINKSPFMPAADGGHGYQGVMLQDENREFVQCHGCGKWMQKITNKHLEACSQLTTKEYKKKYGLNEDGGLVSDETSLRLTKACLKNKAGSKSALKKRNSKGQYGRRVPHSMAFFNKYGTCPLQLKTRLYEFIRCNRELPSQGNKGRSIYKALRRRYGSYGHALSAHGLPWMKRQGTTMRFVFSDGTIYKYNMNQFHDREALYNMMIDKCPALAESQAA